MIKIYLTVLIFISVCILNCSHTQNFESNYNILLSSGGGFTGIYSGHYIDTSGTIISWEGRTFDRATKKVVGNLSPDKLKEMNAKITASIGFYNSAGCLLPGKRILNMEPALASLSWNLKNNTRTGLYQ